MKKTTGPFTKRYLGAMIIFLISLFIYREARSQCSAVPPKEAVFNGDFEKGWLQNGGTKYADGSSIGFKSDLAYAGDYDGTAANCWPDIADRFGVGRTDGVLHSCDVAAGVPNPPYGGDYLQTIQFKDHTPGKGGNGYSFIGDFNAKCASNASALYVGGNPILWAQDVTIIPSQNYTFSAWFAQYTLTPSPAKLNFVVIPKNSSGALLLAQRVVVGFATPTSATMQWQQFSGSWSNSSYTSALISIEVDATGTDCSHAGDFALDDISFINSCQSLTGVKLPSFPSSTVNLCNSVNITASYPGTPSSISWYKGTGTTQTDVTGSSSGLSFNNITSPDTYRICITDGNNCPVSATVVVVNITPSITSSNDASRCGPGIVTLTATGSAGTLKWYSGSFGGSSLGTGGSFNTPNISTSTTYYVDVTNAGCTSARTAVDATINNIPTISSTTPAARCDAGKVTLGATASAGILNWYAASSGGSSLGTGNSFTTPNISTTTSYYVDATNNGCTSARTAVVATVNTTPSITSSSGNTRCGTGSVTLTATGSAGILNWYASSSGGGSLGTGGSFNTPVISSTTTYYVDATNNGCTSARTAVVATVNTIPAAPTAAAPQYCTGDLSSPLTATGISLLWYTQAAPGGSGSTTAPTISTSQPGTYSNWVSQTVNGCESPRMEIDALVVATPSLVPLADANFCDNGSASFTINLNNTLTNPTYQWAAKPVSGSFTDIPSPFGTNATLTYTPVTLAMTGTKLHVSVTETVSGKSCKASSNDAILTINSSTSLSSFTANGSGSASLCDGDALTLTGSAGGTSPFNYTLKLGSTIVDTKPNQTSSSYTYSINSAAAGTHDGTYTLLVTSACPGNPIGTVTVEINKTVISSQPADQTQCLGSAPTFTVGTIGSVGTLTYKWYKGFPNGTLLIDGGNISGASTGTLTVGNLTPADAAQYYVEVYSNGMCMQTSNPATLVVLPVTNNQPSITPKCLGDAANLSIVVTPPGSVYKWYRDAGTGPVLLSDGGTISGSTTADLSISSVAGIDAGTYYVEVTTACGLLTSDKTSVLNVSGVTISTQPVTNHKCEGDNANFNIVASAVTGPIVYQWQTDNGNSVYTDMTGEINNQLQFATQKSQDNYNYQVLISDNGNCPITSSIANLQVDAVTIIAQLPVNTTVCEGTPFNLTVIASAEGIPTYTWIPDLHSVGSNDTYSATSAMTDNGSYTVTVSGAGVCPPKTASATVTVIKAVETNNAVTASDVCLNSNGTVTINPSQSGIVYNAFVNGSTTAAATGNGSGGTLDITINASALTVGTNVITIQGVGCNTADLTNTATIIMLDDMGPISGQTLVCTSANTGLPYSISPVTGADPTKYVWTIDNGGTIIGSGTNVTANLVSSTTPTNITVQAKTINNFTCPARSIIVNQTVAYVQETVTPLQDTICTGSTVKFDIIGANAASYSWGFNISGPRIQANTLTSKTYVFDDAGDYIFTIHPNHPCLANGQDMVATVHVIAFPAANAGDDIHLDNFVPTTLDGSRSSTGVDYKYEWSPATSMLTPNAITTVVNPTDIHNFYTLTVSTRNTASCSASDEVEVIMEPLVHVPNVFSPNGDGNHDVLVIGNINFFPNSKLFIYNQWGELIYTGPGTKSWDGTRNGTLVEVSSYFYVLDLNQDGFKSLAGSVTLIR